MEEKIRIRMYRKYKNGKVFNFLYFIVTTAAIFLIIGSLTGFIPKEVENTITISMGILLPSVIIASWFVVWSTTEDYNTTKIRLMASFEYEKANLQKFEDYLEKYYKIIPEKEKKELEKLKRKVYLSKRELNLISN